MTKRAIAAGLALLGLLLAADALFPPDLTRWRERSPVVTGEGGALIRAFAAPDGRWRLAASPDEVDARYRDLLLAYEDRRFRLHPGVDPLAVARAAGQLLAAGRIVSGASTITMQVARLLEPGRRGVATKLRQMARALQLEWRYSKDEILALYLTLAPFGGNVEGVRAASSTWFGHPPDHLSLGEAALLVALPQSPERLRPDRHPEAARAGRDKVLDRLLAQGLLTAEQVADARAEPIPAGRRPLPLLSPHLAERLVRAAPPGAAVATHLDPALQETLTGLVRRHAQWFADGASAAVMVVETEGRRVRAHLSGGDFFGPAGMVDLTRARRSPGSALKPFIYGLAFDDQSLHPGTLIQDRPRDFGGWAPRNFDRGHQGLVTVREALQQSLNVPAVAVLDRVGPVRLAAALRQAGARLALPAGAPASLPLALGGAGITLEDLTMLYAAIADGGRAAPLSFARDAPPAGSTARLFGPAAAWHLRDVLKGSPLPEGRVAAHLLEGGRGVAFKTGTSYGFRDAWAVGWSNRWTVGVWVGRADGTPRAGQYGRNTAAPLLLDVFDQLPADPPGEPAPPALVAETPPAALRRFEPASRDDGPSILYPPDGAALDPPSPGRPFRLAARGGTGGLSWLIDGQPLGPPGRNVPWQPDGAGWSRIVVVDQEGRSATARVRVLAD